MTDDIKAKAILLDIESLEKDDVIQLDLNKEQVIESVMRSYSRDRYDHDFGSPRVKIQSEVSNDKLNGWLNSIDEDVAKQHSEFKAFFLTNLSEIQPKENYIIVDKYFLKKEDIFNVVVSYTKEHKQVVEQVKMSLFDENINKPIIVSKIVIEDVEIEFSITGTIREEDFFIDDKIFIFKKHI